MKAKNIVVTKVQKKISKKMGIHFKSLNSHLKNTVSIPQALVVAGRHAPTAHYLCVCKFSDHLGFGAFR